MLWVLTALAMASPAAVTGQAQSNVLASRSADFPAKPVSVTDPIDVKRVIAGFNQHLAGFGQNVSNCDHLVRIQIGKNTLVYGGGLAAYGGYCTLGKGQTVALCYEEAIGRFALVADAYPIERRWIETFTLQTCASLD
jgi:hypothetical protein